MIIPPCYSLCSLFVDDLEDQELISPYKACEGMAWPFDDEQT